MTKPVCAYEKTKVQNRTADQRLYFRYRYTTVVQVYNCSTIFQPPKLEISTSYLSSVTVQAGLCQM